MQERKYFVCEGFEYITYNYKNIEIKREKESISMSSNKFED